MTFRSVSGSALVFLLAATLGGLIAVLQYHRSWTQSLAHMVDDTYIAADHMELLIRSMRLSAETVAEAARTDDLVHSADEAIEKVVRENIGISAVLVIDATGHVIEGYYERGSPVGLDLSDRPYFRLFRDQMWEGFYINPPVRARVDGTWSLPLSVPIYTPEGRFGGVIAVAAQEGYFAYLRKPFQANDVQVYLRVHPDGQFIALPSPFGARPLPQSLKAAIARRPAQTLEPQAGARSYDQPDAVGTLRQSPSGLFDVLAVRTTSALRQDALIASVETGLAAFVAALLIGLAGLGLLRWANAAHTEAERARFLGERLRIATDAAQIGVWDLDIINSHEVWDETMHRLYGLEPGTFQGTFEHWCKLVHPDDIPYAQEMFQRAIAEGTDMDAEYRIITANGDIRVISTHARIFRDREGRAVRAIGVNYDVSERVARERELLAARAEAEAAQARIAYDALHDPLTGLLNRRGMDLHLKDSLAKAAPDQPVAYLHIDIDRFKSINDVFGHVAGDHLLCTAARLLKLAAPPGAKVARMGGDEFAIFVQGEAAEPMARACAESFLSACRDPVEFEGRKLWFSASVGLSARTAGEAGAAEAGAMAQDADIALYAAKNAGRDRMVLFSPELRRKVEETKRLADKLEDALRHDRLEVYFQPQVGAINHELIGAEALLRWYDAEDGPISPDRFLPIAREMGHMARIDGIVLRKAIKTVHNLKARGLIVPKVSVNVDVQRLMQPDLLDDLAALGPLPCGLAFELLETLDYDEITDGLLDVLDRLRAQQIEIELDDFGRGRTSLATVQRIRPDRLKIDRSLIARKGVDPVVEAIGNMGHALNIGLTAEGVETLPQALAMARLGCDCLQGFYFARPMPEQDFAHWIAAKQSDKPSHWVETDANYQSA
ncbi:PAS domain S-box-containing protein/diguanylate cyclase (GGDEF)-like protein [Rhodobacter aestuarii]|uniref:PAS domain S-box-containing protein/diguanylate cyclase (GGDEF) domain-containing protein n=1 Tax=Rhodobacter aestuarii TaxID=453582 RepID=A0A1N7IU87_9RHOB|nr:EAL domain-containing protein [Rhodobacter aestuarii]PTV97524.1 PAS domain S-box-containing protein/diguanylate cyclase (GGDEF)-like protein [Rhodobacter aestuarii]SIS40634.1 PAS domain S-box-containing protein/diguanylate cyclase (GGDEF) domain-containing protein [Rhodobacter aestuarii]